MSFPEDQAIQVSLEYIDPKEANDWCGAHRGYSFSTYERVRMAKWGWDQASESLKSVNPTDYRLRMRSREVRYSLARINQLLKRFECSCSEDCDGERHSLCLTCELQSELKKLKTELEPTLR